jgi:hypothetical protein
MLARGRQALIRMLARGRKPLIGMLARGRLRVRESLVRMAAWVDWVGRQDRIWRRPDADRRLRPDARSDRQAIIRIDRVGRLLRRPDAGSRRQLVVDNRRERIAKARIDRASAAGEPLIGLLDADSVIGVDRPPASRQPLIWVPRTHDL